MICGGGWCLQRTLWFGVLMTHALTGTHIVSRAEHPLKFCFNMFFEPQTNPDPHPLTRLAKYEQVKIGKQD